MLVYFLRRIALTIPTFFALMFVDLRRDPPGARRSGRGAHRRARHFAGAARLLPPSNSGSISRSGSNSSTMSGRLLHGDFGVSLATQQKVLTEFLTLFPATVELSVCAMLFAIVIGVPAGAIAAVKRGGFFDQALMTVSLFGYSMPIFWWGLLLIMFVSVDARPDAGVRPHRSHQLLFRPAHRLHDRSTRCCPTSPAPFSTRCAISSCRRSCSARCRSASSRA